MELMEAMLKRRCIRSFKQKPVGKEAEDMLLKAAMLAPSAGNLQSRFFYFVRDEKAKEALRAAAHRQGCLEAPLVIVACADLRSAAGYGERGKELYSSQDVAAAAENIFLAATSLGLGACWVGAFDEGAVKSALKMPAHLKPEAMLPIGYADETPAARKLKPLEETVKFI